MLIVLLLGILSHVVQQRTEILQPHVDVYLPLAAVEEVAQHGLLPHLLRLYMHLFPYTVVREQLGVESLIAVLLRQVYIVDYRVRTLLKLIRQQGIDFQYHILV